MEISKWGYKNNSMLVVGLLHHVNQGEEGQFACNELELTCGQFPQRVAKMTLGCVSHHKTYMLEKWKEKKKI